MKKLVTSLAAFTALTAAASAADLPRRAPPPVFTPVPVFTWTGAYFGINAGYGFDASSNSNRGFVQTPGNPVVVTPAGIAPYQALLPNGSSLAYSNDSREGFSGGGQIGYNYQFTPGSGFVIGFEADAQYVDFVRNRNRFAFATVPGGGINPGSLVFSPNGIATLDFFGTVRGRIGYAWDRTLIYGTGGFAYGSGGGREFGLPSTTSNSFQTGWAAGGGIEYALAGDSWLNFFRASAVTFRVEGLYVNLERENRNLGVFTITPNNTPLSVFSPGVSLVSGPAVRRTSEFAVVRAGVNYKFGSY